MKIATIMILLATLFLSGCAPKSGFLSEDKLYESALSHTKKGEIYNSLEMKASIVATYLNNTVIHCTKKDKEVFLIAVFIDEDSSDESKQGLLNPSYRLTLNGKPPVDMHALAYDDDLIKIAPFRNRWSTYYKVMFEKSNTDTLKMEYAHLNYGKVTLLFSKEHAE
jgi:hypothetical protein